jgi:soluble lytic murein transglycosylase
LKDPGIAQRTALGDYAEYYLGQALQGAGRFDESEREFLKLRENYPSSTFARAATLQAAGSRMNRGSYQAAIDALAPLLVANDGTALRIKADASNKLNKSGDEIAALRQIYFDAPQSAEAATVGERLLSLGATIAPTGAPQLRRRADALYAAGLHVLAGMSYDQLGRQFPSEAPSETNEVWLRAGISYYKGNSFQQSLDCLARVRPRTPKDQAESLYYTGLAAKALRHEPQMIEALSSLRRAAPASPRVEGLLYEIGRYYEKKDDPAQTTSYYDQLVRQYPKSDKADEAQFWLAWRAHELKNYTASSQLLMEHLARYGDVSDNRGKASFWAAFDSERAGSKARALTLYHALMLRYGPGWYGFNAERHITLLERSGNKAETPAPGSILDQAVAKLQENPSTSEIIDESGMAHVKKGEQLMMIAFSQPALNEFEIARAGAPNSPIVNLRIAQIFRARNENFAAINALKRAYPGYSQALPSEMSREVWEIFYPLNWWTTIQQEAKRNHLDPYLVAGVIRQETIFNPTARSRANALGLMQLLPSTGRMVARKYSVVNGGDLFNPVVNIQLGAAYLADLVEQFGRFEYVAAAYNGGPTRVARWMRELPSANIEDWVDSLPLSETRLYVQGVYRNARQYQRLYDEQGHFKSSVPGS